MTATAAPADQPGPDLITLAFDRGWGPWLTPLRGKIPVLGAWESLPAATEPQVREWLDIGYNLGLRTGSRSGLVVIDDDQGRNGASGYTPPPTGLVSESPTGGRHYYYRAPDPCPSNSTSKLAPYVDVRGEGGQVVFPGSSHPVLGQPYRWAATDEPAPLPAETLAALVGPVVDLSAPTPPPRHGTGYADTALAREAARVGSAAPGSRNDTLNRAAFNLGQLVATGALDRDTVTAELAASAAAAGLSERETAATIRSGLAGGAKHPREVPQREQATASERPTAPEKRPEVLVPGSHHLPPDGEYMEQGTDLFASQVVGRLPGGALYRRAQLVGEIHDGAFRAIKSQRMRSIVDEHVRLGVGKETNPEKDPDAPPYVVTFRTCTNDMAALVLAYAETQGHLRDLRYLAKHPVCVGPDFLPAAPGWNAEHGVFLHDDAPPEPLDLPTARAVLEDLVVDFPFAEPADRANFFGLMLTPILRPAIREPVPMHLIGSPVERTGKTKLAEIVHGCSVLGHPTPAMQLGVREEEREKRLMAILLSGASTVHLDNLDKFVDSPALASLLTSTTFQGRELNYSRILSIPNGLSVVASGNNLRATGEIAKRIAPINLLPSQESPETRSDYRHPNLREFVEAQRPRVLAALLGLVAAWRDAGQPHGSEAFGGFERWAAVLGGIMAVAGYPEWLSNLAKWRGGSDEFGLDLREFVRIWHAQHGTTVVDARELFEMAVSEALFERQIEARDHDGKRVRFGRNVLSAVQNRVVGVEGHGGYRILFSGSGSRRKGRLEGV